MISLHITRPTPMAAALLAMGAYLIADARGAEAQAGRSAMAP